MAPPAHFALQCAVPQCLITLDRRGGSITTSAAFWGGWGSPSRSAQANLLGRGGRLNSGIGLLNAIS